MKNLKLKRIIAVFLIAAILFTMVPGMMSNVLAETGGGLLDVYPIQDRSQYEFSAEDILVWAAKVGLNLDLKGDETDNAYYPVKTVTITKDMIDERKAVILDSHYNNDVQGTEVEQLNAVEASAILDLVDGEGDIETNFNIRKSLASALGLNDSDIVLNITIRYKAINNIVTEEKVFNYSDKMTEAQKEEVYQADIEYNKKLYESGLISNFNKQDTGFKTWEEFLEANTNNKGKYNKKGQYALLSVTATLAADSEYAMKGSEYKFVVAGNGKYVNKWSLIGTNIIPVPEIIPEKVEFYTELDYKAVVGTKDVGYTEYTIKNGGTCVPNYDINNPKKDADVTAIIKSKNDLDILTVDGKVPGADKSNPNNDGWYYLNAGDKKVVAKEYPFETYNNLNDNGTVVYDKNNAANNYRGKVTVVLGSVEDMNGETLTSEENISIQWPYRIIEDVQEPATITEDTDKVVRTVTTNLPTDKEKLPEGWAFADTDLGKSQHQMYKEYTKEGGDVTEEPVFTENGRKDTVDIDVDIKWPAEDVDFITELDYKAVVGTKDVGYTEYTIKNGGTCVPNYDKENPKKDADVTAIIKSKNDLDILTVDGKVPGADKSNPNADGWYYLNADDKKVVAKEYPFETYNNLKDNGTVVYDKNNAANNYRGKVKVVLGSIEDKEGETLTSEENISIQWPYRIIEDVQDPAVITDDTDKVVRIITTNLPTDEEKLPDGWKFTDTDLGKSQHQMYKEYTRKNGDVTEKPVFTENGRKDTVTADINIKWKDTKADKPHAQTGVTTTMIVAGIAVLSGVAFISYRKSKRLM